MTKSSDGGLSWANSTNPAPADTEDIQNPMLGYDDRTMTVFLFFTKVTRGPGGCDEGMLTEVSTPILFILIF